MKIRAIYLYNDDYYCDEVGKIDKLGGEFDRYFKIDSIEIEFAAYKVTSKKEAISKITSNYFNNNSPDIVIANSSISNPLLGMLLLENIKKYIIIYDKNDVSIHNEEFRQKWILAAEKYPNKILLTEISFAKLALEITIVNLPYSYGSQEVFFTPLSSRSSLETVAKEVIEDCSYRNLPTKPIQKIIYLYNKYYEDISDDMSAISDLVNIASYQISTHQQAISIINENTELEGILLIANTSIAKYLEGTLPDNIEKFIVIPDINNTEWQELEEAQVRSYQKTKISYIRLESLYLHLYTLIQERNNSINLNDENNRVNIFSSWGSDDNYPDKPNDIEKELIGLNKST